jgi:hypothetical protein
MRLITIAAFAGLLTTGAHADTIAHCTAAWNAMSPAQKAANTATVYASRCRKADYNAMPAVRRARPVGVRTLCKDGTYSMSMTGLARCSGHDGVVKVL